MTLFLCFLSIFLPPFGTKDVNELVRLFRLLIFFVRGLLLRLDKDLIDKRRFDRIKKCYFDLFYLLYRMVTTAL